MAIGFTGTFNPSDNDYANLYRPGGRAFGLSDWDGDGDGLFNESDWNPSPQQVDPDRVGGYLHVAVGRIPAASGFDCEVYLDKVIAYEQGRLRRAWPRVAFLADHTLDGAATRGRCDAAPTFSGIEGRPGIGDVQRLEWAPAWTPELPAPWTTFDTPSHRRTALTTDWLVHLGHGHPTGWTVEIEGGKPLDREYVLSGHDALVRSSKFLPVILSAGCDTRQLMGKAPSHAYRSLLPDCARWLWFDAQNRRIEDKALPDARFASWPIRAPTPHPYDSEALAQDACGQNFAASWLCQTLGGAIAYAGASMVHQGAPIPWRCSSECCARWCAARSSMTSGCRDAASTSAKACSPTTP
jgi:hypothetical protein